MKEKIIDYIENLESKANDSDKFFAERNNALIEIERLNNIIKEAREYIKENSIYYPTSDGCQWVDQFKVLEILDKVDKENDIEFDVLKALNTDLDDDVKMG